MSNFEILKKCSINIKVKGHYLLTLRVASILQQCTANAISALMAVNTTTQNWLKSINSCIVGKRWRLDHLVQIIVLGTAVDSTLSQTFFYSFLLNTIMSSISYSGITEYWFSECGIRVRV